MALEAPQRREPARLARAAEARREAVEERLALHADEGRARAGAVLEEHALGPRGEVVEELEREPKRRALAGEQHRQQVARHADEATRRVGGAGSQRGKRLGAAPPALRRDRRSACPERDFAAR